MGIDSAYGSKDLKENGKWFDISSDMKINISHFRNEEMLEFLRKNLDRDESEGNEFGVIDNTGETVEDEEKNETIVEGMAKNVINDWDGFVIDEDEELAEALGVDLGEEFDYSPEIAKTLMLEKEDFQLDVTGISLEMSNFQKEQEEQDIKN